jgi:hypothetical protein
MGGLIAADQHSRFENTVKTFLHERDFLTASATYHDVFPDEMRELMQRRFERTTMLIRARADRFAIHRTMPIAFEWDAKTHITPRHEDITIELIPLVSHMAKSNLGARAMFAHFNPYNARHPHSGFWVNDMPPVRVIMIPAAKWTPVQIAWFESLCSTYFPTVATRNITSQGSGDPFAIFDSSIVQELPSWQELIETAIDRAVAA